MSHGFPPQRRGGENPTHAAERAWIASILPSSDPAQPEAPMPDSEPRVLTDDAVPTAVLSLIREAREYVRPRDALQPVLGAPEE